MRFTLRKGIISGLLVIGGWIGLGTSSASAQAPAPAPTAVPNQVYQTSPTYTTTVPQYRYVYRPRMGYRFFSGRRYSYGAPRFYRTGRRFGRRWYR